MIGPEASRSRYARTDLNTPEIFASIFGAIPEAAVLTDLRYRVQLVNRTFEQLFDVDASSIEGTNIYALFESEATPDAPTGSFSTLYRSRSGREFPVEMVVSTVHGTRDEPVGFFFSIRDVSDRKLAEEALRTSERRYAMLFERANDALIIFEPEDERILEVNPRACELYGFSPDEFVGRSLQTLTEDVGRGRNAIKDILGNGGLRNFETRHFRKDGQPIHLQISCSLISFDARPAVLTIIRDISEQKGAERALRAAKEAAESATRMKSDFVAKVSHEIRTPMNGVMGMAELLMETPLNDSQREYAESIAQSGESLLNLVNDLLDLSKIEAGKLKLEKISFDPHRMTGEVVELFAPRAEARRTRIAYYVDGDVPRLVIGDPYRIRQVLNNLVSNAVKFTDGGEIIVTVAAQERPDGRTELVFEVVDTGIGIPSDSQGTLFESFTQVDSDTTRKFGGTGLGLAISRQLVSLMNGTVDVRSSVGEGSTFRFSAVVDTCDEEADRDDVALDNLGVLVVDDNDSIRSIICRHLHAWNVEVHEAATATEALHKVSTALSRINVVLIRRSLPDADGIALAKSVRGASCGAEMHIVLLTDFKQRSVTQSALDAGVNAFLPSPVWPHRLRQSLVDAIGGGAARSSDIPADATAPSVERVARTTRASSASILLVEDNITNQKVATAMLARYGLQIDIAPNGAEALKMIEDATYDLILMDCQMPVMDGFETTRHIRQLSDDRARMPIIALTANAVKGDRERCLAAGMDDYLTKPFRPDVIRETLLRWLPGRIAA